MDLHWKVCPYCGNNHFDPYEVGPPLILAEDVVAAQEGPESDDQDDPLVQDPLDSNVQESGPEELESEPPATQD